jgi:two-component system response regulator QseB
LPASGGAAANGDGGNGVRILLVEDDAMIGASVQTGLRQDGFAVDWVRDGQAAELALANEPYDLMLLDLGLPKKAGLDVLLALRRRGEALPVLILTARDAVAERVKGLDSGADDYLVKPFDLDELAARIRALLRRRAGRADPVLRHGDLTLNPATHETTWRGNALSLTAREFALLEALLERPGAILSRAQLEERVYGWGEEIESNAVEVHIHGLRRKLGADFIRNVRGVGYKVAPAA